MGRVKIQLAGLTIGAWDARLGLPPLGGENSFALGGARVTGFRKELVQVPDIP
jgi:hypothetical protein